MVRRTDTRERMLASAAALFHAQGYHATGLNQLVSAGGAPKGSLYFHFPGGKEQLAAEAVTLAAEQLAHKLEELLSTAPSPGKALVAVVNALGSELVDTEFSRGCPITTVALDAAEESLLIREACAAGYESWRKIVQKYLVRQGVPAKRATALSTLALSAIEGALVLAKINHDTRPLRTVAEHLKLTVEREL